jgi:hypothetical protein
MGVNGLNPVYFTCLCVMLTLHQSTASVALEKSKNQAAKALLTATRLVASAGKWWDRALRYASPASLQLLGILKRTKQTTQRKLEGLKR